ncbi:MAG: TolC family protein [Acidobacteriota bacterium]
MKRFAEIACLILTASCLLLPVPVYAQEDAVELSLSQCLLMALDNNLELVAARYSPKLADSDITARQAAFDLGFEARVTHAESQQGAIQSSNPSGSETDSESIGVSQNLKFGANYSASFFTQKQTLIGGGSNFASTIFSSFQFDFTVPILRGFGTPVATEQLVLARYSAEVSRHDLMTTAELIMERVEGAYWDVVAAREALRIERLSLKRAQELLDLNRRKVEVGSLAPIEITQAEAGVASQEENVIVSETVLLDAEDELRRLMGVPADDPMWDKSIHNLDAPLFQTREVDLDQALATAMRERSELHSRRQTLLNRELSEKVARRQLRNQLDFNVQYAPQGLSPSGMTLNADFGNSLDVILDGDEYNWQASLTYRATFGNRAAKATMARSVLSRQQSETSLADQEQTVRVEVRRAVRGVESGMKRVEAGRSNVVLQRRKLEAEQKKYENGMSTSFEVLTFQSDLATAELAEVRARLDYLKSLASLARVKGTLLASRGLSLAE